MDILITKINEIAKIYKKLNKMLEKDIPQISINNFLLDAHDFLHMSQFLKPRWQWWIGMLKQILDTYFLRNSDSPLNKML